MRYWEIISEAPVGDYELKGDFNEPGSFTDKDKKLLKSPYHAERVRKAFDKTPYVLNLYFLNTTKLDLGDNKKFGKDFTRAMNSMSGITTPENLKHNLGDDFGIQPKGNDISIVYLSNANEDNSLPMTPWIMAHRFAHGLGDGRHRDAMLSKTWSVLEDLSEDYIPLKYTTNIENKKRMFNTLISIKLLLTMKSARDSKISGADIQEELVAQYLISGKIYLQRFSKELYYKLEPEIQQDIGDPDAKISITKNQISQFNAAIEQQETKINDLMKNILDYCKGKLLLTV